MNTIKRLTIAMVILLTIFTFVSCNAEKMGYEGVVEEIKLVAAEEKTLASTVNRAIKYWEFMATPKFALASGETIFGIVSNWKRLPAIETGNDGELKLETTLGRYTSGDWLFELRAKNDKDKVVAIGSTQQIIREGIDNTVSITLLVDRHDGTHGESAETGSMHAGFEVNRLDASITNMQVVTYYQKVNKDAGNNQIFNLGAATMANISWTPISEGGNLTEWYMKNADGSRFVPESKTTVGEGRVYYEGTLSGIQPGPYVFTYYIRGKDTNGSFINLGGQSVDVMVIGGEETRVKGTLLANEYVMAGLKITAPGVITGTINGKNYIQATPGTAVALEYLYSADDSAEAPARYFWYINGVQTETSTKDFSFQCPKDASDNYMFGIYKVSCVPVGILGSLGSASVDVIFNPESGPNVGEFVWPED